jgi:DNA-binding response OmpR family regulator
MQENTIHILLADDNMNEHFFFAHAMKQSAYNVKLDTLAGGVELLDYIQRHTDTTPDILFLDLNMPMKNGKDCLAAIRSNTYFKSLPVVIYSTSDAEKDINETYALGADLYVRKPNDMDDLKKVIHTVIDLHINKGVRQKERENYVLKIA